MNKKRLVAALATVAVVATLFAGCGKKAEAPKPATPAPVAEPAKKPTVKIGLATDQGGLGDKSFNDSAVNGLKKIESEFGIKSDILESKQQENYVPNLQTLSGKNDLTFGVGFMMHQAVTDVATAAKDKKFAIIDDVVELPNVCSITFKEEEGSFLMGVLAGKTTKTNKVGFLGGMDMALIQKFEAGYIAGVKSVNPAAAEDLINRKNVKYTGNFTDSGKGKEMAKALFNSGCDVVFHASGACGLGLLDAAKELRDQKKDVWAIGVDMDQAVTVPNDASAILSSMVKRVDNATYSVSKDVINNTFQGGKNVIYGLKEQGVGMAPTTDKNAKPEVIDLAKKYEAAIVAGKIKVPATLDAAKSFQPVAVQ